MSLVTTFEAIASVAAAGKVEHPLEVSNVVVHVYPTLQLMQLSHTLLIKFRGQILC